MASPCSIFGLGVQVNIPLAGLRGLPPAERLDVAVTLGPIPPHVSANAASARQVYATEELDARGRPAVRVSHADSYFHFDYADGTEIVVDSAGTRVWAESAPDATVEDTGTYLLGPTLGFVLRLRGVTCLHGSAVVLEDRAIAFVGPAGAGKSSTAAAFARSGHAVLTDDVAALREADGRFWVQPAYPRLRLWPDSSQSLFGSHEALPRITPTWDKRYVDLNAPPYKFAREAVPLGAIYVLGGRGDHEPRIDALSPRAALMALVAETYSTRLIDGACRAGEFDTLARLVASIPVRQVNPSSDFRRLERLVSSVAGDFRALRIAD